MYSDLASKQLPCNDRTQLLHSTPKLQINYNLYYYYFVYGAETTKTKLISFNIILDYYLFDLGRILVKCDFPTLLEWFYGTVCLQHIPKQITAPIYTPEWIQALWREDCDRPHNHRPLKL